jgi:hypothetical protein
MNDLELKRRFKEELADREANLSRLGWHRLASIAIAIAGVGGIAWRLLSAHTFYRDVGNLAVAACGLAVMLGPVFWLDSRAQEEGLAKRILYVRGLLERMGERS